jgi:hypothetical protein
MRWVGLPKGLQGKVLDALQGQRLATLSAVVGSIPAAPQFEAFMTKER